MNLPFKDQPTSDDIGASFPPAISAGWFYVPYAAIGDRDAIIAEKARLTFTPKFSEEDAPPVTLFVDMRHKQYLGVPRAYGMSRFPWLRVDDRRSLGETISPTPRLPDPNNERVKDPILQGAFMDAMLAGANSLNHFTAMASTGSGKTVVGLRTAALLGRKTLIMVHLERLMDQWLDEISTHLGLPPEKIGTVQGPKCQWQGRDFVVAMMPSLSQRNDYSREFLRSFGTIIVDECHRVGTPMLSTCAPMFPAKYRIGLSATPNRKDGGDRVLFWHLGPISVVSKAPALHARSM